MSLLRLAWGKKVSPEFRMKIFSVIRTLGWTQEQASHLMACIAFESGESFSPSIKNAAGSGATGLIQFMPRTAKGMGSSIETLEKMSPVEQLDMVYLYFTPYASKIKTLADMYMAILLPSFISAAQDAVLFSDGVSYRQNSGLDINKDGKITKQEAARLVQAKLDKGLKAENCFVY